jgi:hypothetical protein
MKFNLELKNNHKDFDYYLTKWFPYINIAYKEN